MSHDTDLLDVLIVGAGLSGIGAAWHLQRHCPQHRYVIVEARQRLGGTWDLFRYPGVRSDSDMYTLGYRFRPWREAKAIADGPAIRQYVEDTAREAGIERHIHYGQRVMHAAWDSQAQCWQVSTTVQPADAEAPAADAPATHTWRARFLYLCAGYYSYAQPHWPRFEGEKQFQGRVVHAQFWPDDLPCTGRRVVVVGSGATAVTLVPALAAQAAHVTMLQRSPTYMASRPARDALADALNRHLPARLAYGLVRWKNVAESLFYYRLARQLPQLFKRRLLAMAQEQLGPTADMADFTPRYAPWDQRLCLVPDGDFFHAVRQGQASVVTDEIASFTPQGLRLRSGRELPADVVVMATGLNMQLQGNIQVTVDGQAFDSSQAMAYKGMMLSNLPNCALTFGYTNASWTLKADLTAEYVCRLLRHMRAGGWGRVVAQPDATVQPQPFLSFTSGYVQRALHLLPRQGDRKPWQVRQNYLYDMLVMRFGRLRDGVLQFEALRSGPLNPPPPAPPSPPPPSAESHAR